MTLHITRIDTYIRTSMRAVTFYRGNVSLRTYINPSFPSLLRLTGVASAEALRGRARLHPNVTGWTLDRLDTRQPEEVR